jgi:predicted transcriptional regulator
METIKLKQNLHSLIDKVKDKELLEQMNKILNNSLSNGKASWDSLSEEEKKSIEEGLRQLENGEGIDFEEINKSFDGWLKG